MIEVVWASIIAFFAMTAFWVWAPLVVLTLILFWAMETESSGWATFWLIVTVIILQYLGKVDIFGWIQEHPWDLLKYIAAYFGLGTTWSFIKWYLFCIDRRDYALSRKPTRESSTSKDDFERCMKYWTKDVAVAPTVGEYKSKITGWMLYWPWSLLWTFLHDFVRRVFDHIFKILRARYQAVSDSVFKGMGDAS